MPAEWVFSVSAEWVSVFVRVRPPSLSVRPGGKTTSDGREGKSIPKQRPSSLSVCPGGKTTYA
jgi:hypothetical protein